MSKTESNSNYGITMDKIDYLIETALKLKILHYGIKLKEGEEFSNQFKPLGYRDEWMVGKLGQYVESNLEGRRCFLEAIEKSSPHMTLVFDSYYLDFRQDGEDQEFIKAVRNNPHLLDYDLYGWTECIDGKLGWCQLLRPTTIEEKRTLSL